MAKWYLLIDGQNTGPIGAAEMRALAASGRLRPSDKVRREDMAEWHEAKQVKGLFSAAGSTAPSSATSATATLPLPDTVSSSSSTPDGDGVTNSAAPNDGNSKRTAYDGTAERIRERVSGVWADLRTLNFWEEIVPIDATNFPRMLKDPVLLAVFVAGIAPLLFGTIEDPVLKRRTFAVLFAFLWGIVFKHYVIRANVPTKILACATSFTAFVGILLPLTLNHLYWAAAESSNFVVSLIGNVFGVGICEETCKILPVVAYLLWKRSQADPKACILIGVFSGLGFAATENVYYAQMTANLANHGVIGAEDAMQRAITRSLSCVFGHALYTGIFAYFLTVAFLTGRRYIALALVGLVMAAALHGIYDWFCVIQPTIAALIVAGTFILFYAYLTKLEALAQPAALAES